MERVLFVKTNLALQRSGHCHIFHNQQRPSFVNARLQAILLRPHLKHVLPV